MSTFVESFTNSETHLLENVEFLRIHDHMYLYYIRYMHVNVLRSACGLWPGWRCHRDPRVNLLDVTWSGLVINTKYLHLPAELGMRKNWQVKLDRENELCPWDP
jgi:hypothetical protein